MDDTDSPGERRYIELSNNSRKVMGKEHPMSVFDWLLIGHLLGDWVLQNDWMAKHKQSRLVNPAIALHCTIYTAIQWVVLRLVSPASLESVLGFTVFLFLSHWIIDAADLAGRWNRLFHQTDVLFMRIVVDQVLHLVVLALLTSLFLG